MSPSSDGTGVHLLDDQAARYGDFDDLSLVGLIEGEWPDRPRRNIFYPTSLLTSLGWPSEKDRRAAADARFLDLLQSALARTRSRRSARRRSAGRAVDVRRRDSERRTRRRCRLTTGLVGGAVRSPSGAALRRRADGERDWHSDAQRRIAADASGLSREVGRCAAGVVGQRPRNVSRLSVQVLRTARPELEEEPDDEEVMDPRRQGQFVHEVFEAFFERWQQDGHRAITPENLDDGARRCSRGRRSRAGRFSEPKPPRADTAAWSPAAAGLGEAVFRMEAERPVPVVERLLEHGSKATFTFDTAGRTARCAERQSRSDRSARRRHVPPDRLQARLAADRAGRCSCRSTASAPSSSLTAIAAGAGRSAKPRISRSRDRSGSCRCSRPTRSATKCWREAQQRLVETRRRDRARRVSADAGRRVSLRDVQLCRGVPEGLCRRCLSRPAAAYERQWWRLVRTQPTPPRARRPSIRAERRARGVGRHRQDARAGRALRQPAARRRRSRSHPRDHVHAQGRRRDARAHHRAAARSEPAVASSMPARWRELQERLGDIADHDDRRVLPVAAARVSARSRRRSRLSTWPTKPRCRGWSTNRSIARCASAARSRERTRTSRWCSRSSASGACAPACARCSTGGSSRLHALQAVSAARPARSHGRVARAETPRDRLRDDLFDGVPGGLERVPRRRPASAPAVRDAGATRLCGRLRQSVRSGRRDAPMTCRSTIDVERRGATSACSIDRLRGYFLTQDGEPRERASPGPASTRTTAHRRRLEAPPRARGGDGAGGRRGRSADSAAI